MNPAVAPLACLSIKATPKTKAVRSHSAKMPQWSKNYSPKAASDYEEQVIEASIQESLQFHLNPYRSPFTL